jgi:ribonuclease HI
MKRINFDSAFLEKIKNGEVTTFYRINDKDDISIDDSIEFVDNSNKVAIGIAKIQQITIKKFESLTDNEIQSLNELEDDYSYKNVAEGEQIKIIGFNFLDYKTPKSINHPDVPETIKMFSDGGSRGNPGPSASGYVLLTENDEVIVKKGVYLGITTNNQAEYKSLLFGLEEALSLGVQVVYVYMDSLLVINQMKGLFKIKNRDLMPIYHSINEVVTKFKKVTFTHVPREFNKLADKEVNDCLDSN